MNKKIPHSVINVSVFGSHIRKDNDVNSDLDVLVVVNDGSGTTPSDCITEYISEMFGEIPSISWYGENKIRQLFSDGDLFGWHLFLESEHLYGTKTLREIAGKPSEYKTALNDIEDLRRIAVSVDKSLKKSPENAVFEMGILYVCARNIAMPAAWQLARKPAFGRYSPYAIPSIEFPIPLATYELAVESRMASQRGRCPPTAVTADLVMAMQRPLLEWCDQIIEMLRQEGAGHEQIKAIRNTN